MARQRKAASTDVDETLAALESLSADHGARSATLAEALRARHARIVAKAARLAEDGLCYELIPALIAAYSRFLDKPAKTDPSCLAKKAVAHALVALDCDDLEFFLRGIAYRQHEPVWGGTADTAIDVRASCAMGLVASGYSRALVELTALLHDPEAAARAAAVRAVVCGNPREAEQLLRARVHAGDAEPAVLGECFSGLLAVAPDDSVSFVAGFLAHKDDAVRELAALALGESRLDAALAPLKQAWHGVLVADTFRRALLRAASAHRSEAAADWLLDLVAEARAAVALDVLEALALYKQNAKLTQRLAEVLAERGDSKLTERYAELWH